MTKKKIYTEEIEPEILGDLEVLESNVNTFTRKVNKCEIDDLTIDSLGKIAQIHNKYTKRRYLKHGSEVSKKFDRNMDKFLDARHQLTENCICKQK